MLGDKKDGKSKYGYCTGITETKKKGSHRLVYSGVRHENRARKGGMHKELVCNLKKNFEY